MKIKTRLFLTIIFMLWASNPPISAESETHKEKAEGSVNILIVDGFNNHDWKATTKALKSILSKNKSFHIIVSTIPDENSNEWKKWSPNFSDYDTIIQNTNNISNKGAWPQHAQRNLEKYITTGGSMFVMHSGNNAFKEWPEYNKMIGLGWRNKNFGPSIRIDEGIPTIIPKGEGLNTGHGKRVDALVTRLGEHPIHAGLPRSWMAADTEVYWYPRGPAENITILSYAQERKTKLNFPTEWVVNYGKGKVYCSTFGHFWHNEKQIPRGIQCVAFQTSLIRSLLWLSNQEIKPETPESFPTKDSVSLINFEK